MLTIANGEIVRFQMLEDSFAFSQCSTWVIRLFSESLAGKGRLYQ